MKTVSELDTNAIREHVLESLAWVRDVERRELDAEVDAGGGNLRIDSKEGEAVCILVEDALEVGELVEAADLRPEELTSISSLTRLFEKGIAEHHVPGKDAA